MSKIKVPNEQVLREGVEHAELHMNQWDQRSWVCDDNEDFCGTTACLAGHILLSQGYTWDELLQMDGLIPREALNLLGFRQALNGYCDCGCESFGDHGDIFRSMVFGYTHKATGTEHSVLAGGPDKIKLLKERITEVTGIEL